LLEIGNKAPEFILPNTEGEDIALSQYKGNKIILWFYPKASTPG
tara:strand:- start:1244 stop:1375 length:132 start_codon:yes stop_codon:yes gene_type:complete